MQSLVYSVEKVDIEELLVIPENPRAISITAHGWVPTTGWSHPALSPHIYVMPPRDGILDVSFLADVPTGLALQVFTRIRVVESLLVPHWVIGVRVHASTNRLEARIAGLTPRQEEPPPPGQGVPVPWPFPWWAPKAVPPKGDGQ
ncbi:MAG: hypothetical protein J0H11_19755 [Rhizobiales bacterium]|nr:hypothetical protein [Hyphomicrobiales bacterium]